MEPMHEHAILSSIAAHSRNMKQELATRDFRTKNIRNALGLGAPIAEMRGPDRLHEHEAARFALMHVARECGIDGEKIIRAGMGEPPIRPRHDKDNA